MLLQILLPIYYRINFLFDDEIDLDMRALTCNEKKVKKDLLNLETIKKIKKMNSLLNLAILRVRTGKSLMPEKMCNYKSEKV